jgi:hypothetical protein
MEVYAASLIKNPPSSEFDSPGESVAEFGLPVDNINNISETNDFD